MRLGLLFLLGAVGCSERSPRESPVSSGWERATSSAAPSAVTNGSSEPAPSTAHSVAPSAMATTSARGQCTDRQTLKTPKGDVSCYPFRCRDGACLTRCDKREDCAGSDGPGDLAENGWPLDCRWTTHQCVPLPPQHVRPRPSL